jgi:threonylcarbamoyladenosine tRNA methylthiotransferase MtaB
MKRFRIVTLGCKVNQCESAAMGHLLAAAGFELTEQGAPDMVVVNTCTVTGKAAMQSRQAIRQAQRKHPSAEIIVTGCYAQTAPSEILAIGGIQRIIGHGDKMRIVQLLSEPSASPACAMDPEMDPACGFAAMPSVSREGRTRAFLKIQDGCNTRCTYCIVPRARGTSRSMPIEDVHRHVGLLGDEGFQEVVLTGIHLGAYGADMRPPTRLAELLATLTTEHARVARYRISSIEPTEVEDGIIDVIQNGGTRICRHLHIPLQSGDNLVLRRMGRPYTRERFAQVITAIHNRLPAVAIGVDVMAGFPGESDEAFENTRRLIEVLPIAYLHVFPFSPRKGTPAAVFKPRIPEHVAKERCRQLRQLGEEKRRAFYRAQEGQLLRVLIESEAQERGGLAQGLSDNYVPVNIPGTSVKANTLVNVRARQIAENGRIIADIV